MTGQARTVPPPESGPSSADTDKKTVDLTALQQKLDYRFSKPDLLLQALTHRSFGLDQGLPTGLEPPTAKEPVPHNERLEYLGDAVLDLAISSLLFDRYSQAPEGALSRWRSALVNTRTLSDLGRRLSLGDHLKMGRGEVMSGGRGKTSILGNALEAVVGAVFLDGGFPAARTLIERLYQHRLEGFQGHHWEGDYKSMLQEWLQGKGRSLPIYEVMSVNGPPHERLFEVSCQVAEMPATRGRGPAKRVAEQAAAREMLSLLDPSRQGEGP